MPELDKQTLLFAYTVLSLFMAGVTFVLARATPGRGLELWGTAILCCAAAYGLYVFRGRAPLLLTFVLANVMALGAGACAVLAYARLTRVRPPRSLLAACLALGVAGLLAVQSLGVEAGFAAVAVSLALAVMMLAIVWVLWRHASDLHRELRWLASAAAGFMALTFGVRASLFGFELYAALEPLSDPLQAPLAAVFMASLAFVLSTVALIGLAAEQQRSEAVRELSRDSLTGFVTRTAFDRMLPCLERQVGNTPYAVLLLDMDHFKQVNDTHGHEGGDLVLAHAARLIANSMRLTDLAVRYGGEEFCLILRGCDAAEVGPFAQRLLKLAGQQRVRLAQGAMAQFTLSAGIAVHPPADRVGQETLKSVIRRADQALYQSKQEGRNRYTMATSPGAAAA